MKYRNNNGFTLPEFMIAAIITSLAVAAAMSGFIYVLHTERSNSIQVELDMDVRKSIEWLRHDLRLADMNRIVFYPAGAGPYQAICFPMVNYTGTAGQSVRYDTNGLILWDKTVIYHVLTTTPYQLRMTVFSNRNNDLSVTQRQDQLNRVVAQGDGSTVTCESNWSTRIIFENLVDWKIWPQTATFDGYSAQSARATNVPLGSMVISNASGTFSGNHTFTFTLKSKNPSNTVSTGYKIGVDSLFGSPNGLPRDGETQPVTSQSVAVVTNYRAGGWSGNYDLLFPATASGQSFTIVMTNDCWDERNFDESGSICSNASVSFDTTLTPTDMVAGLKPQIFDYQWASRQTLDWTPDWPPVNTTTNDALRGCAVRVLLRGKDMPGGGALVNEGPFYGIAFHSGIPGLRINHAYFSESASLTTAVPDAKDTGTEMNFLGGNSAGSWSTFYAYMPWPPTNYSIRADKGYVVSFLVDDNSAWANARYWTENNAGVAGCWIIPRSASPDENATRAPVWSTNATVVASPVLYAVRGLWTFAVSNGTWTSQIVDTQQDAPLYRNLSWSTVLQPLTRVVLRLRTSDTNDMATAPAWTNTAGGVVLCTASNSGWTYITNSHFNSVAALPSNRFVQVQAELFSGYYNYYVSKLKDFTLKWDGVTRVCNIGGTFSKGPDYGIFELTVDGRPLTKGCRMDLTIYQDIRAIGGSNRIMSKTTAEIFPRNTGKGK